MPSETNSLGNWSVFPGITASPHPAPFTLNIPSHGDTTLEPDKHRDQTYNSSLRVLNTLQHRNLTIDSPLPQLMELGELGLLLGIVHSAYLAQTLLSFCSVKSFICSAYRYLKLY